MCGRGSIHEDINGQVLRGQSTEGTAGHIKALTLTVLYVFEGYVIMRILIHCYIWTGYSFYHYVGPLFTLLDNTIDTFIF